MGSWGVTSKSHFAFLAGTLAFFPVSGPEMVQRRPNPLQRPTPLMLRSNPSTLQLRPSQNLGAMLLDELLKLFAGGTREIGSSLCASREHPCNKAPLGVVRMVLCAACRTKSFHARPVEDVFTIFVDVSLPENACILPSRSIWSTIVANQSNHSASSDGRTSSRDGVSLLSTGTTGPHRSSASRKACSRPPRSS